MGQILIVNFGGPRNLEEVPAFLTELLCDRDVIRTRLPDFLHKWFFTRLARKRAVKVSEDYEGIGGGSPIYFDTEAVAQLLGKRLDQEIHTFHRYLKMTHAESLKQIESHRELLALPMFPQFSYATTGSIARYFSQHLPQKINWIKSYADHPRFIEAYQRRIGEFLEKKGLKEEETVLLFSAHGLPQVFVDEGDPYEGECHKSFSGVMKAFPKALGKLSYQSKFGRGEWLKPYTDDTCERVLEWHEGRKNVVFVPISFTSDHIETLYEIEKMYLPIVAAKGLNAYRCPALNREPYWIDALVEILEQVKPCENQSLIR